MSTCPNNVWNHTSGCDCAAKMAGAEQTAAFPSAGTDYAAMHEPPDPFPQMRTELSSEDREALVAALGDGPPLSGAEQQMLETLTDPALLDAAGLYGDGEGPGECAEEWETFNRGGYADNYACQQIADVLRAKHEAEGGPGFVFGFESNSEGEPGMYSTAVWCDEHGFYVSNAHDIKYLGRTSYTGLRGAVEAAVSLEFDWQNTVAKARKAGLLDGGGA